MSHSPEPQKILRAVFTIVHVITYIVSYLLRGEHKYFLRYY